jgi:hypothetical protein
MHPRKIGLRIIRQERLQSLDGVAESLEGDPHTVHGGGVRSIQPAHCPEDAGISVIHRLQQALEEPGIGCVLFSHGAHPLNELAKIGGPRIAQVLAGSTRKAGSALRQITLEGIQLGDRS